MTLHFVYAYKPDNAEIQAPHSITRNLYNYLSTRTKVIYHEWDSRKPIKLTPDDVLLGHPHYEPNTVVQRVFRDRIKCKARCLIHPFHHRRPQDNMPFDFMAIQADKIFSICGPYWYDTIEQSPFAHWKPKMIRLDSAVDPAHFPFLRTPTGPTSFNPPGKRKLIYMGGSTPHKNLEYLTEIMAALPDVELHWFGGHDHLLTRLKNVHYTGWQKLDQNTARNIVTNYDIMINVSCSDANPTTLTESRAWGIITACTKESGYVNDPFFTELYLGDIDRTIEAIRGLLNTPSDQLYQRAVESRAEIEHKYTWDNFCNTVWSHIAEYF